MLDKDHITRASGTVTYTNDPLTSVLYTLLRDCLRFGAMEDILIKDIPYVPGKNQEERFFDILGRFYIPLQDVQMVRAKEGHTTSCIYSNGWLANYAHYCAKRIRGDALDRTESIGTITKEFLIQELVALVQESAPLTWAAIGPLQGTEAASKWERKAQTLLQRIQESFPNL